MAGANVALSSVGQTTQIDVTGTYSDGTIKDITDSLEIESSNTLVATVAEGGLLTAWAPGETVITALTLEAANLNPPATGTVRVLNGPAPQVGLTATLISPADAAVLPSSGAWSFVWSAVPGAGAYHLIVQNSAAIFPIVDMSGLVRPSWDFAATGSFAFAENWRWWVQADVGGTYQGWSSPNTFSVQASAASRLAGLPAALLEAPQIASDSDEATEVRRLPESVPEPPLPKPRR